MRDNALPRMHYLACMRDNAGKRPSVLPEQAAQASRCNATTLQPDVQQQHHQHQATAGRGVVQRCATLTMISPTSSLHKTGPAQQQEGQQQQQQGFFFFLPLLL